jgi:hypothetical protein
VIHWDLDSLTIGDFSDADEAKYESDYGRYQDGKWTKDSSAVKPDYIVSKYEK